MRIGIDAHNLEGQRTGVGRYLVSLLNEWNKFDLSKDLKFILYFKDQIPEGLNLSDEFFEKKVLGNSFFKSNVLFVHFFLSRAAKHDKIDILFCPGYISPVFYKGKIALALHDIIYQARPDLYNWPSLWDKILLKKVSQISARKAKTIFVPSEFSKKEVLRCCKVDSSKVFNIPLAVDQSFKQIDDKEILKSVKNKYQIKDKFIFYIGSIFNRRHLPEMIKAFENIALKFADYQFLIIGTNHTSPFDDIDELARSVNQKLGRPAILRQDYLTGKDLVPLYNAANLLVWLSDYEGFGLPVLEALACGTLVITSPMSSIPEVAGESAIYVKDSTNVEEITRAIDQGLTNQELRQNLIRKGLEQARKFSWKRCAQQTLDALVLSR